MSWAGCYREDRGDGAVIVVPPTISTQRLIDPLMAELAGRLRQYNRRASEVVRIQLRVALHVGPVGRDSEGLTGQAVIAAARIVDAPVIKARLAAEHADLIFAASDYVYDQVVRNCGAKDETLLLVIPVPRRLRPRKFGTRRIHPSQSCYGERSGSLPVWWCARLLDQKWLLQGWRIHRWKHEEFHWQSVAGVS